MAVSRIEKNLELLEQQTPFILPIDLARGNTYLFRNWINFSLTCRDTFLSGLHEISHDVKAAEQLPPITRQRFWKKVESLLRLVKATNTCSDEICQILEGIFDALAAKNEDKMKILRQTSVVPCLVDIAVQNVSWHIRKWLLEILNLLIR